MFLAHVGKLPHFHFELKPFCYLPRMLVELSLAIIQCGDVYGCKHAQSIPKTSGWWRVHSSLESHSFRGKPTFRACSQFNWAPVWIFAVYWSYISTLKHGRRTAGTCSMHASNWCHFLLQFTHHFKPGFLKKSPSPSKPLLWYLYAIVDYNLFFVGSKCWHVWLCLKTLPRACRSTEGSAKWNTEWSINDSNCSVVWDFTIIATINVHKEPKLSDQSMSTKNQSYQILKLYNIMPLQSAVIASKRRINLAEFATPQHGLLLVDLHRIQRIFNPFHNLSSLTRGRILDMIRFLNSIQSSPQNELIDKTATILLQAFNIDLSKTISPSVNILKDSEKIARNGYSISSLETATDYDWTVTTYQQRWMWEHLGWLHWTLWPLASSQLHLPANLKPCILLHQDY